MTDTLAKWNELQKKERERLLNLLNFWKGRRESNIVLIKKLNEDIELCDRGYTKAMEDLRKLDG